MDDLRKLFDTIAAIEESAMRGYEDDISPYDDDKRDFEAEHGEGSWEDPEQNRTLGGDELGDDPWGIGEGGEDTWYADDDPDNVDFDHQSPADPMEPEESVQHTDLMERDVREMTNKIWEAMDEQILDPRTVAEAALSYLSESQVADMARINEWFSYEDEEDNDDEDGIDQDFDWNEGN